MTVTFFKSDAMQGQYPNEEIECVIELPENAQLTYGWLRDTSTGEEIAIIDPDMGDWTKNDDDTHWSDIVIGDSRD